MTCTICILAPVLSIHHLSKRFRLPTHWPGAQLGPGGQSYCKRPGRTEAWTLPAGLSAATSHYLARPAREGYRDPHPANRRPPVADGGGGEKTQALPRAGLRAEPDSRPVSPPQTLPPSPWVIDSTEKLDYFLGRMKARLEKVRKQIDAEVSAYETMTKA